MPYPLIRTFSYHYKKKLGYGVGKIPLHLGSVCPNRKAGGCIFCAASAFTPGYLDGTESIEMQLKRGKEQFIQGRFEKFFAYFQQETPTAVPPHSFLGLCNQILDDSSCIGLILSTRPDHVSDELLYGLKVLQADKKKSILFELGLQSVHNHSLEFLNRNHSYEDFLETFSRIRAYKCFEIGVHVILGIPHERYENMLQTFLQLANLGIDSIKIHHLQVIKGTKLESLYHRGEVSLFSLDEYLDVLLRLLPHLPNDVVVHRLWAASHPDVLLGPRWNVLPTQLSRMLRQRMENSGTYQGKEWG